MVAAIAVQRTIVEKRPLTKGVFNMNAAIKEVLRAAGNAPIFHVIKICSMTVT